MCYELFLSVGELHMFCNLERCNKRRRSHCHITHCIFNHEKIHFSHGLTVPQDCFPPLCPHTSLPHPDRRCHCWDILIRVSKLHENFGHFSQIQLKKLEQVMCFCDRLMKIQLLQLFAELSFMRRQNTAPSMSYM